MVLGVVTWFFLNDTPDKANWLDNEEKQALKAMIDREREHAAIVPASPRSTLREVLDASGADVYPRLLLPDQYPQRH